LLLRAVCFLLLLDQLPAHQQVEKEAPKKRHECNQEQEYE
jgi:hypothetical protein